MYSCSVNSSSMNSDFWHSPVQYSEGDESSSSSSIVYKFHNYHASPSSKFNLNIPMMNTVQVEGNGERCIVKYNEDQQCLSFGEFYNYVPDKKNTSRNDLENIYYTNSQRKFVLTDFTKSSQSTLKTIKKKKRRRTTFTTEQIVALEEVFKRKPYVHREERIQLMHRLNINETSIKVWFQNRRRLSEKKCKEYILDSPTSDDCFETISDKLEEIESYIKVNSDENGYVTLDNEMMTNLVEIIDENLPQNINLTENIITEPQHSNSTIIYEPISPVSLSETSEVIDQNVRLESHETLLGISDYYYL